MMRRKIDVGDDCGLKAASRCQRNVEEVERMGLHGRWLAKA